MVYNEVPGLLGDYSTGLNYYCKSRRKNEARTGRRGGEGRGGTGGEGGLRQMITIEE